MKITHDLHHFGSVCRWRSFLSASQWSVKPWGCSSRTCSSSLQALSVWTVNQWALPRCVAAFVCLLSLPGIPASAHLTSERRVQALQAMPADALACAIEHCGPRTALKLPLPLAQVWLATGHPRHVDLTAAGALNYHTLQALLSILGHVPQLETLALSLAPLGQPAPASGGDTAQPATKKRRRARVEEVCPDTDSGSYDVRMATLAHCMRPLTALRELRAIHWGWAASKSISTGCNVTCYFYSM